MEENFPQREPRGKLSPEQSLSHQNPQTLFNPGDLDPAHRHLAKILAGRLGDETERGVFLTISQTWGTEEERGFALQGQPPGKGSWDQQRGWQRGEAGEAGGHQGGARGTHSKVQIRHFPETPQKAGSEGEQCIKCRQGEDIRVYTHFNFSLRAKKAQKAGTSTEHAVKPQRDCLMLLRLQFSESRHSYLLCLGISLQRLAGCLAYSDIDIFGLTMLPIEFHYLSSIGQRAC